MMGEGLGTPEDIAREEERKLQISKLFQELELKPATAQREVEGQYTDTLALMSERDSEGHLTPEAREALGIYNGMLQLQVDQYDDPEERMAGDVDMAVSMGRIEYVGGLTESAHVAINDAFMAASYNDAYPAARLTKLEQLLDLLGGPIKEEY